MANELGTLIEWNAADGVGRIRLDTGEVVRVGQVALGYQKLQIGRRCELVELAPHPLGGRKALKVTLRHETVAVEAEVAPPPDRSQWMRVRINTSLQGTVPSLELDGLLEAYLTFTERVVKPQIFGVDSGHIPRSEWPELAEAAERALRAWQQRLTGSPGDAHKLDKAGREFGIEFLRRSETQELGTLDGLDAEWVAVLERLKKNVSGRPSLACLGLEAAAKAAWVPPDPDRLREAVNEWEAQAEATFPRELAALASIADGLDVGDTPVIRPVALWTDNDDGIEIGAGSTSHGNLTIFADGQVADRNDDGVELHRFKSLSALLAALVG